VPRICIDLNVWCSAALADFAVKRGTASQSIVEAVRSHGSERGGTTLVISLGMLQHLAIVLQGDLDFSLEETARVVGRAESYAFPSPSLTLGGVGVLPIRDAEDRHVLETAWSGGADVLTTSDLRGFVGAEAETLVPARVYRLRRADQALIVAHPFETAAWLRGEDAFGVATV